MLTLGVSFHLPSIVLSVCSWSSLYFWLRRLEPWRRAEWHCRAVTVVHAFLITLMSGWACFVQGPWPFTDAGGLNTPLQVTTSIVCLGYFLFDFAWCLYFQTEGIPMLFHHSISILGLVWMLCAGRYGTELMATVCGSEATNPLLQLRWFLKGAGRYHTLLGEVVDALFMVSFFTIRLGVGSVLIYTYFQQPTDFMGRLGAVLIYLISWVFWVSIFQYAVYKYTKKYHAWRGGINGQAEKCDNLPEPSPSQSGSAVGQNDGPRDSRKDGGECCECSEHDDGCGCDGVQQNGLRRHRSGMARECDETDTTTGGVRGTDSSGGKGVLVNG
ncbi:hypothetical protein ACOMHN_000684 [Nucella lapillus]